MVSSVYLLSIPYYRGALSKWEGCPCTILTCADGMVSASSASMPYE